VIFFTNSSGHPDWNQSVGRREKGISVQSSHNLNLKGFTFISEQKRRAKTLKRRPFGLMGK
jgi:hypothetical protein